MNTKKKLIVTMDIGSSKISCMQAITDNNDITTVIGLSVIASKGIKSGIITDFNSAAESIAQALLDCEKQSNQSIEELSVSIASHKCSTKIMKSKVKTKDEKVSQYDVQYSI